MDEITRLRRDYKRQCYVAAHWRELLTGAALALAVAAMILSWMGR